jgi:hypothetical protein
MSEVKYESTFTREGADLEDTDLLGYVLTEDGSKVEVRNFAD